MSYGIVQNNHPVLGVPITFTESWGYRVRIYCFYFADVASENQPGKTRFNKQYRLVKGCEKKTTRRNVPAGNGFFFLWDIWPVKIRQTSARPIHLLMACWRHLSSKTTLTRFFFDNSFIYTKSGTNYVLRVSSKLRLTSKTRLKWVTGSMGVSREYSIDNQEEASVYSREQTPCWFSVSFVLLLSGSGDVS